ncbi:acetyl-CoA acetyltransferase [Leminorella grimontii]|uniref:Acetyl-CoA acetyltransferase n=1 Tax=Leminorella grimontii TaxID=82981 RepID=A0AAV5N177_9GAMM|nr:acetyl-CoA C-acetyltransferase [Leminorella grimontii]KFC97909.1 3-ketoacyl-CoA thiolase/acetyl-CoA acetyltransferase [Leminorella grimontii ATCC 33999 = DSM 5078]GKX55434.1 acetyl-CoA acetyltransferase [Leminorella grimontii]VFS56228.1 Acetyl-CoA acetyltransferase [Leminorella grimontii]
MTRKVYIVAAKRAAIGNFCGSLSSMPAYDIASQVMRKTMEKAAIKPEWLDEAIVGNVLTAGQGQSPGRNAALRAGIPDEVPAYTLNMLCGSGMKTIMDAASHIKAGDAEMVMAAGMENMSSAPFLMPSKVRQGVKMGGMMMEDSMLLDGLTDSVHHIHMGVTAENIAEKHSISRQEQDAFALASQQKAAAAQEQGKFRDEIVPVVLETRKGPVTFDSDEYIKPFTTLEDIERLKPAFKKEGGTVTAANASGLNDSACAVIVASEEAVEKYGLKPIAEIVGYAQAGVDPKVMGLGPVPAISKALKKAGKRLQDMELIELNEAFAAQSLGVLRELAAEHDTTIEEIMEHTNVNGGAIALGHPLGASGGRIVVSLIHEMKRRGNQFGLASLCIGGGMGVAIVIKNV